MGCMKCGKDITDDNVFCADCLQEMEKYPVKRITTDMEELFADPELQAVYIATNNASPASIAIKALNAGKHVMLEKPMPLSAELGKQIIAARDAAGKQLQMGMVWRQTPEAQVVRKAVEDGKLGEIYQIVMDYRNN